MHGAVHISDRSWIRIARPGKKVFAEFFLNRAKLTRANERTSAVGFIDQRKGGIVSAGFVWHNIPIHQHFEIGDGAVSVLEVRLLIDDYGRSLTTSVLAIRAVAEKFREIAGLSNWCRLYR